MAQRAAPRPLASVAPRLALRLGPIAAPRAWLLRTTALLPVALASFGAHAQAPTGGQVVAGQAGIAQTGTQTTITQGTDRAAINWQGFNVGAGHTVQFQQPNAGSWTLNRVVGPDPSVIAGRITANGGVALVNQSGILFTRGAQVDVGALIATAPGITNENFMAGRMRFDQAAQPGAQVRNEGRITVMDRGIAVLAGPRVSNTGEIRARLGRVVLAGAEAFTLDLAGDGLISIDITQAVRGGGAGVVTNEGLIEANGGSVLLTASAAGDLIEGLVRNTGTIRANTEAGQPGQVALRATGGGVEVTGRVEATGAAGQRGGTIAVQSDRSVRVAAGATLDASGGAGGGTVLVGTTGVGRNQTMARSTTVERGATIRADATVLGQGGTIAINSTEVSLVEGTLSARGGPQGGNGGFVEISGQAVLNINQAPVDVTAPNGAAGSILIDPRRIRITNAAAGGSDTVASPAPTGGGTVSATTGPAGEALLVRTADIAAVTGNLILEATLGITVEAAVTKATGNLTLNTEAAANNPSLTGIEIGASISLTAGSFAANTAGAFTIAAAGVAVNGGFVSTGGSVTAGGGAAVTATGAASFGGGFAGGTSVTVTAGSITQTAGSITATAGAGTVSLNGDTVALGANVSGQAITITAASGTITQTAGAISASGGAASLILQASGAITQSGGTMAAGALSALGATGGVTNAASIALGQAGNAITGISTLQATGAVSVTTGGAVSLANASSDTSIALTAVGTATLTGTIAAPSVTVTAGAISQTGGGINAGAGTGAIAFNSNGAITQSVGASVTGGALTVRGAGGGADPAASFTFETGTNTLGSIDARTSGTLLLQASGNGGMLGVAGAVSTATGLVSITGNAGTSLNVTGAISGIAAVTLSGNSIALGANVTGGSGAVVALQLRGGGLLSGAGVVGGAGASTVRVGAVGGGSNLTTGASGAVGSVTLDAATLNAVAAGTLVLGVNSGGGTTATAVTIADAVALGAGRAIDIRGSGAIAVNAGISATDVTVTSSGGTVAQTTGTIAGGTGGVSLTGNGTVSLGSTITGATIALRSVTGNVTQTGGTITASGGTATLTLSAAGTISQSGGTMAATSLIAVGAAGTGTAAGGVNLGQGGNTLATISEARSAAALSINAGAGATTLTGAIAGANITITATTSISQTSGSVNAGGGSLSLLSDGTITQSGTGTITTGGLTIAGSSNTRSGIVTLDQSTNAIAGVTDVGSTGAMTIHGGAGAMSVALADATGLLTLTTGTTATLTGAIRGDGVGISAATSISQSGGSVNSLAGGLTLRSNGTIGQSGGSLTTTALTLGGITPGMRSLEVTLDRASNAIGLIADARATGAMTIHTGAPNLAVTNANATGLLTLTSSGSASLAGTLAGNGVTITATSITQTLGSTIAGGAGTVTLQSNGTVTQSGGTITGAALTVTGTNGGITSANTITLNQAGNSFAAIGSARASGVVTIRSDAAALAVGVTAGNDIVIRGGGASTAITLTGTMTASGSGANNVSLLTNGSIAQNAGAIITATTLTIGGASVTNAASATLNEANVVGSVSANVTGALAFTTTGAFSTNGNTINAGSLALTALSITVASGDTLSVNTGDLALVGTTTSGNAINIIGTLTGVPGQRIVLRGNEIDISSTSGNGIITANGLAAIEVGPRSPSLAMLIDASSGGVLRLDTGTVNRLLAAAPTRLQFGETTIDTSTIRGTDVTVVSGGIGLQTLAGTTRLVIATDGFIAVNAPLSVVASITGQVELRAAGAITGAGTIATGTGGLVIRGADGSAGSSAGQVNLTSIGNQIQRLDARSSAALFVANQVTDIVIRQARGTSVAIDAEGRLLTVEAGINGLGITATSGNVGLRATSITVGSSITAGSGATATLQIGAGGTLTGAGVVTAPGTTGTVEIGASSAITFSIGGVGLPLDVLNNAVATTIRVGQSTFNGGATVTAATTSVDGVITRPGTGTLALIGGDIALNANISAGSLSLTSTTGALTLGSTILTATTPITGRVTLDSAAGITQSGFSGISAPEFAAIVRSGDITLNGFFNAIGSVVGGVTVGLNANGFADTTRGLFASGSIALSLTGALGVTGGIEARGGTLALGATNITQTARIFANTSADLTATGVGGLALNGVIVANTLTLSSGGAVTQNASGSIGPSSAGSTTLTVRGASGATPANGAVSLAQGNGIGSLSAAATGALTITSNAALAVTSAIGAGVTLTGTSLSLTGAVDAGVNAASLTATAGGITQNTAGLITASSLTVSATGGTVTLDAGNPGRTTPLLWNQVGALGAVTVTGAGRDFTFHTTPALTLSGAISVADAVLIATNGTLSQTAGSIAGASVALAANGTVTLAGTINTGSGQTTITSATGAVTQTAGSITAGNFAAQGTTLDFAAGTNALSGTLALSATAGDLSINQSGNVTLGSINAATVTGSVSLSGLSASGAITVSAGGLTSVSIPISAGGALVLRADALSLGAGTAVSATSIAVGPRTAGQAIQIGSADTGTTLGFNATTLARLTAPGAPLTIGETLIGASRVTAGDVTINAALTTTGEVTVLSNGNISLPGAISASVAYLSATGSVIQPDNAAGVGGTYSASTSLVTLGTAVNAGGTIDLRAPNNSIGAFAARSTGGGMIITAGAALNVTFGAEVPLVGGGTIIVNGATAVGDVFLQASSLVVTTAITAQAGGTVTLRADTLAINAPVTASGGTVALETLTLGGAPRPITLGAEVADTLSLTQAELNFVTANRLTIGRTDGTTGSAISVAGAVSLPGTVAVQLRLIGGSLALGADLNAAGKNMDAFIGGATTRTAGIVTANALNYRGIAGGSTNAGAVTLDGANRIANLNLLSGGAVDIGLDANGGITNITGLRGASVAVAGLGTNGTLNLTGGATAPGSTTGAFSITGATALIVADNAITAANGLTLSAGTVTINQAVTATAGTATLASTTGALTLNSTVTTLAGGASFTGAAGTQVDAAISVTGGGASFSGAGLATTATITVSGGNLTATNTGTVSIGGVVGNTTGNVSFTGGTTFGSTAAITGRTGVTISAGTTTIGALVTATTGTASLTSTLGALTLNAGVTTLAGGATFASGASATLVNAPISVTGGNAGFTGTGFTSTAPGTVRVAGGDLTIANTGVVTIGGALETTTGSIGITGATTLTINATINAANGLTLSAGTLGINNAITLTNGPLGLIATGGDLTIDAGITTLAGSATFSAFGATQVNAPVSVSGGALAISGAGFTSTAAGTLSVLTAHALGVTNTGAVTIGGAVSNALGATSITGATTLATTATIGGQTGVTLSAASVTLGGAVSATTGNAAITATGGTITANAAVNAVAGNVTLDATGALVLNGAITSVAGGTITLNAGAAAGGTAADSITQTATGILGGAGGGATNLAVLGRSLDAAVTLSRANRLLTLDAQARGALAVTASGALGVTRAGSAGSGAATSSVTLTAASLNLTGAVNAGTLGTVTLNALSGGITQTATGIITAATLAGGATGAIALNTANNAVAGTGALTLGDDFALLSTVGLTVASALNTPGNAIVLTGASLAIQGALTGGTVALAATAGGITQSATGMITTPSLTATATAGVGLNAGDAGATQTAAWNQVTTLASGSGGTGGFTLRNSRDLSVTGTVAAGTGQLLRLDVTGTPVLQATSTLSAPSGTIAIAASGPIDLRGALTAGLSTLTSTTGLVTQTTGAITGGLAVQANGTIDIKNPANAITNFSANAIGGQVDVLATTAMTVVTATNVALHGGSTTTIAGVTGTTVLLTAPDLTLNSAATATTGDVQLRADAMAIAAGVNATAGEVRIEQLTLGGAPRGISLGAEVLGSLSLTTAELAAINTPTLIFGRSTGSGAGAIAGQITLTGAITVPGSVTNTVRLLGSGIAVNGSLSATGTAVTELRALTQSITATTGGVSGQALIATAPFGSVTLSSLNDFANVTGSTSAGGSFTYRDANGFQVAAPGMTAAAVSLTAESGTITQATGAPIIASSLFALARTGSVLLDGGSAASAGADLNQIGTVVGGGAGATGVFRLRNAAGFTINGVLDNGAGGALGTAQLFASTGGIVQIGGLVRAGRLEVTLPGGGASFGLANAIGSLGTSAVAGNYTLNNTGSLALAGPVDVGTSAGGPASTTTITLGSGSLTQGSGARLRTDALVVSAPVGDVRLTAGGSSGINDLSQVGTLAGITAGGVVDIRLGAPTLVAGLLLAGSAAGTPTGALTLEAPGITIGLPGQVGTLIRAGTVVLRTQPGFDGPANPGSGDITQQGGAVEANNLSVSAPAGNILMNRAENRFAALTAGVSADGSPSGLSLVAGGTIDLTEGGSGFTVQSGIAANGLTRLTAGNALTFNTATSVAGPVALSAGGLLTIAGGAALATGGAVTLFGGSGITVQGSVSGPIVSATTGGLFNLAGGSVAASPNAPGMIDVSAGGLLTTGGNFSAHTIVLRIGGGVDISNTVFNAAELVNVTAGGNMNVSGPVVNANAAQFRTQGFLALNGGTYTLGRVVVFAGFAGISTAAPTVVRNRNPGTFPGIVFDTRQTFGSIDPLAIVQADLAGVAVNDQPTQVRTPNADLPGDFGPSNNNAAGNARVRLDALQSPVFLLLDGGSFTGVFNTAGRIGVHGRGGSSSATGVLVDPFGRRLEGQSTASLADATRPATGAEISRFRLNDCVISSFNCVAPTQVIVVPVTVPTIPPLSFGIGGRDPDAVSPNVAEEWSTREDEQ